MQFRVASLVDHDVDLIATFAGARLVIDDLSRLDGDLFAQMLPEKFPNENLAWRTLVIWVSGMILQLCLLDEMALRLGQPH